MNISFRIRRKRMVAVGVLALALGGLAAVFPARSALGAVGTAVITDSVTTGDVTGPDTIVKCTTSQIPIGGTQAVAVPVACLTEYNGEWIKVSWSGTGVST